MPKQSDAYNCGFDVAAAIPIIARDFIGSSEASREQYNMHFQYAMMDKGYNCKVHESKICCYLSKGFLQPITQQKDFQWNHFDYLKEIRLQWFEVLDQLAYTQHSVIPRREEKKIKLTDEYTEVAGRLSYPDWNNPISKKEDEEKAERAAVATQAGVANQKNDLSTEESMSDDEMKKLRDGPDDFEEESDDEESVTSEDLREAEQYEERKKQEQIAADELRREEQRKSDERRMAAKQEQAKKER